jgi:hypothetical protein
VAVWRDAGGQPPDPRDLSLWAINRFCCFRGLLVGVERMELQVAAGGSDCAGRSLARFGLLVPSASHDVPCHALPTPARHMNRVHSHGSSQGRG